MEIHQLRYTLKVAELLHFSRAADFLGITQPSLSQQIDKLENELGVRLFERKTRSVKLTAAGEEFISHAQKVLSALDQLGKAMKTHVHAKKERIEIGSFVLNMGPFNIVGLLQHFFELFPTISVQLTEKAGCHELVKLLRRGLLDGAFLVPSADLAADQTLACHTLIPGTVKILINKDHSFAAKNAIRLHDLAMENCVSMSPTFSIYSILADACRADGFNLKIVSHCNQVETMVDLVSQGFGFSFLSSQFTELISHPDIVIRPLEPPLERNLSFVYLNNSTHLPALIAFRDYVLNTFKITRAL